MTNPFKTLMLLLIGACCLSLKTSAQSKTQKPNILIIMADDLDSRQLSCYGGKNINTSNIDQLAKDGLKFNNMIASEAMCIPTRASLLTGLYPMRHGAYQNHKEVSAGLKSVVQYMVSSGYKVGLSGKDHVTKPREIFPFDIIKGFEPNCISKTDVYYLDSIRNYITKGDKPYCLFVMSINPHAPWTVGNPKEFDPNNLELPPHWVDTKLTRENFCKYLAEVRELDNQVGALTRLLKETGEDKNTIVIFLGEQGPQFPGGKWTLYDNGQKSSMIIRWPGVAKANAETEAIIQYEDIVPTLIDIAGGKVTETLDGKSFLKILNGQSKNHREVAFGIHNNIPEGPAFPIRSVSDGNYKFILNLMADNDYYIKYMLDTTRNDLAFTSWNEKAKTDPKAKILVDRITTHPAMELYDLKKDPYELNNLAYKPEMQKKVKYYREKIAMWMKEQGDPGAESDKPLKKK